MDTNFYQNWEAKVLGNIYADMESIKLEQQQSF